MPFPTLWPGEEVERIAVRLPRTLLDELDRRADAHNQHRSRIIRQALEAHLS